VLLVTLPERLLTQPASSTPPSTIGVRTLFDASSVASLLGDGSAEFLRICDRDGACQVQSRFFSLILASAQLIGSAFTAGSYLSVMVGTYGTYFEAYYVSATGAYTDIRLVYQNFGKIAGTQQPPELLRQCTAPGFVGLSRTPNSGWTTSVFHAQRYAHGYLDDALCAESYAPPPPPWPPAHPSPPPFTCDAPSPEVVLAGGAEFCMYCLQCSAYCPRCD